jgi:hypothetical protein
MSKGSGKTGGRGSESAASAVGRLGGLASYAHAPGDVALAGSRPGAIRVALWPSGLQIVDGNHRIVAASRRGEKTIEAHVTRYSEAGHVVGRTRVETLPL